MSSTSIQFIQRLGMLVLQIPGKTDANGFATIPELMAEKMGFPGTPPLSGIVVNMEGCENFAGEQLGKLCENLGALSGRNKFFFVGVPDTLRSTIKNADLGSVEIFESTDAVFQKLATARNSTAAKTASDAHLPKSADDVALDNLMVAVFQEAAIHTLGVQCQTKFKAGKPIAKSAQNKPAHDIAASMGMMSKGVSGSVALGFKESTFLQIMGRMLGETYDTITSDVEDGCGEILNIIFGQAKKALGEKGHQFGKTLPTIFIGPALRVRQLTPNPSLILPFESDLGQMVIELGYRRN